MLDIVGKSHNVIIGHSKTQCVPRPRSNLNYNLQSALDSGFIIIKMQSGSVFLWAKLIFNIQRNHNIHYSDIFKSLIYYKHDSNTPAVVTF